MIKGGPLMGTLLLHSACWYGSCMRVVGCQVLSKAAVGAGELAWRLSALRREVEGARWTGAVDVLSRYPRCVDHGDGRFTIPVVDGVQVLISICFATGIVAFRQVGGSRGGGVSV